MGRLSGETTRNKLDHQGDIAHGPVVDHDINYRFLVPPKFIVFCPLKCKENLAMKKVWFNQDSLSSSGDGPESVVHG